MLILDVNSNDKGTLLNQKSVLQNGLFLNIKRTICNKLSLATKQINFTHLSFNRLGDRFLACDLHGTIYMFDLNYNRYLRLNRLGITCTALAYNLKCKTEYLVACIDGTIKCFNTETKDLVGWMKGHEKPIMSLSVHPTNGDMVISFSADLAQLWDLKTFECKQKLSINAKKNIEIVEICFAPCTNDIVAVFKDDSIYVWSMPNVNLKCQFNTSDEPNQIAKHFYKCLTVSSDGKLMVLGSRNNYLDMFSIESNEHLRQVVLNKSKSIKNCLILPTACYENKVLVVMSQEGSLDVYNIETDQFVFNLNCTDLVHNQSQFLNEQKPSLIYCSQNARYFCSITHDGCIQVFDLDSSPIKKLKATSSLMKTTTINSTKLEAAKSQSEMVLVKKNKQAHVVPPRIQNLLNSEHIQVKLKRILKCYNEYPARYRMFIWKMLLKLPENYEPYAALIEQGTHPTFSDLIKKYPVKSQKCVRLLQRTLSALAFWSPIFAECDYLPLLIFPFVKLYQNNQVVCFEIIATFINNWCQHWFEFYPNPPMNILNMIENLLAHHDRILLDHFIRYRITCQIYGWSLLETVFSEVFSKNDWQILFDNIFSNHPGFLLYLVAAYSICNRTALIQVKEIDDAKYFFRHRNPLSVHHLINESIKMQQTTPADIDPCKILRQFEPLSKGTYPVFNKRPRFISDYQIIEKTKILQQEMDYLKEREAHLESHKLTEGRKLENEFILKQMLWDTNRNRMYKQSVEEYERKQTELEEMRLRKQQELLNGQKMPISVAGEPLMSMDKHGNRMYNKMRAIDENFDDVEQILTKTRKCRFDASEELDEEDLKEIENELIETRANALKSQIKNDESSRGLNFEESKFHKGDDKNKYLNDASLSSNFSLERGREQIEYQESEVMKRVYDLRKTLAIENRKKANTARTVLLN